MEKLKEHIEWTAHDVKKIMALARQRKVKGLESVLGTQFALTDSLSTETD
jgi:hypothetical protein